MRAEPGLGRDHRGGKAIAHDVFLRLASVVNTTAARRTIATSGIVAPYHAAYAAAETSAVVEFVSVPGSEHYFEGMEAGVYRTVAEWLDGICARLVRNPVVRMNHRPNMVP